MSFGLIFDLDGTLMDTVPVIERSQEEVLNTYGLVLPEGYSKGFAGLPLRDIVARINKDFDESLDWRLIAQQTGEIQFHILKKSPSVVFDGLVDLLNDANQRGLRLAVGTSSTLDRAHGLLHCSGLWGYFQEYVSIDDVTDGKPAPDIFLECAKRLDYPTERCVVFGDGRNDLLAARAAGMKFIGFSPGGPNEALSGADMLIGSYRGISLRALEGLVYRSGK